MSTTRKPSRKVFQMAALGVCTEGGLQYCCCALDRAAERLGVVTHAEKSDARTAEEVLFHRMYRPRNESRSAPYFGTAFDGEGLHSGNRERRVYALLLAAEIMRDPKDLP